MYSTKKNEKKTLFQFSEKKYKIISKNIMVIIKNITSSQLG